MTSRAHTTFLVAAWVELLTLVTLFTNIGLGDDQAVAGAVGPVHGVAYLLLLLLAAVGTHLPRSARLVSLVPGVGGLLSLWLQRRGARAGGRSVAA